jgi:hypothetical protein
VTTTTSIGSSVTSCLTATTSCTRPRLRENRCASSALWTSASASRHRRKSQSSLRHDPSRDKRERERTVRTRPCTARRQHRDCAVRRRYDAVGLRACNDCHTADGYAVPRMIVSAHGLDVAAGKHRGNEQGRSSMSVLAEPRLFRCIPSTPLPGRLPDGSMGTQASSVNRSTGSSRHRRHLRFGLRDELRLMTSAEPPGGFALPWDAQQFAGVTTFLYATPGTVARSGSTLITRGPPSGSQSPRR